MLSTFTSLRLLVLLRQIAGSLKSIADSQSTLAQIAIEQQAQAVRPPAQKITVSEFDPRAAQASYRRRVMEEQGFSDEAEYEEFMGRE